MKSALQKTLQIGLPALLTLSMLVGCPGPGNITPSSDPTVPTQGPNSTGSPVSQTPVVAGAGEKIVKGKIGIEDGKLSVQSFNSKAISASVTGDFSGQVEIPGVGKVRADLTKVKAVGQLDSKEVAVSIKGEFEISLKAGCEYTFEAFMPLLTGGQYKSQPIKKTVLATDPPSIDVGSLVTKRTGSIQGLVALEDSKDQVLGADVFLAGGTSVVGKVADDGRFTLAEIADGTWNLVISKSGYEMETVKDVVVTKGKSTLLKGTVTLKKKVGNNRGIFGTVSSSKGGVIIGATVTAYPVDKTQISNNEAGLSSFTGVTNEEGKFEIMGMPKGKYQLQVYRTFYKFNPLTNVVELTGDNEKKDTGEFKLDIDKLYFGKIAGQAVDEAGKPIQGVLAQTDPPVTDQQFSDAKGNFTLDRIMPGDYNVSVSAGGYCTVIKPLRVENDENFVLNIDSPIVMKKGTDCSSVDKQPQDIVTPKTITIRADASASVNASVTVSK